MNSHHFTLCANTETPVNENMVCDFNDLLIDALGDDFVATIIGSHASLDFYRHAPTLKEAITSAIDQLKTVQGVSFDKVLFTFEEYKKVTSRISELTQNDPDSLPADLFKELEFLTALADEFESTALDTIQPCKIND